MGVDGAGLVPWVGGPPHIFVGFIPKRSIPKPDQHRTDIIGLQQVVRHGYVIGNEEQELCKISH